MSSLRLGVSAVKIYESFRLNNWAKDKHLDSKLQAHFLEFFYYCPFANSHVASCAANLRSYQAPELEKMRGFK